MEYGKRLDGMKARDGCEGCKMRFQLQIVKGMYRYPRMRACVPNTTKLVESLSEKGYVQGAICQGVMARGI
jgi:hypothetical protein